MAGKLTKRQLNTEVKRLKAKLIKQGLMPECLPANAHFEIAAQDGAELVEDVSRRARNCKVFMHKKTGKPTGKVTSLHTIGSMHYQEDEGGDWQEIDTQLVPSEESGWDWEISKSHWRLLVKNSGWVAAEKQGVGISWKLTNWGYLNKTTKEYQVKGQADYSKPIVDGSGISWQIFPDATLKLWATPDQLKEDIELPQNKRNAIIANNPYGDDGVLVYIYEVKWDKCPRIEDEEQGEQSPNLDWESTVPVFLKNVAGKLVSVLPSHFARPLTCTHLKGCGHRLTRRFIKKGDKRFLLLGLSVQALKAIPAGTIVFDPTVDEQVGANADDGKRYSGVVGFLAAEVDCMGIGWVNDSCCYIMHCFLRWAGVTIDGTITAATIEVYQDPVNQAAGALMKVYGVDEDNPAAPTSAAEFDADPLTSAAVDWDGSLTKGDWNTSPSLNSIFQELVDSYTISNDAVMLQLKNDGGEVGRYNCITGYGVNSALAAKLSITYTPPPLPRYPAIIFQCPAIV